LGPQFEGFEKPPTTALTAIFDHLRGSPKQGGWPNPIFHRIKGTSSLDTQQSGHGTNRSIQALGFSRALMNQSVHQRIEVPFDGDHDEQKGDESWDI
jgi:hypothetical protein